MRVCEGAFAEWVPFSPVADEAPPLWTQCLDRLISLPINLSFPIHILLFNVSHDFNRGFFLCTPMHVNNMSCNSASYRSITKVLFPILFGSSLISFIHAAPFLCRPVSARHGFSLQAFLRRPHRCLCFLSVEAWLLLTAQMPFLGGGSLARHPRPKRNGRFFTTWY